MTYKRKFIILKNDYGNSKRNCKGHSKLEMKGIRGVVTLSIENAEKENYYNVVLLANDKKNSAWNLGKVFTDELGKGKGEYTFIQRELETNKFPLSKLSAIVILRGNEVILGGYIDKDDKAIESYIESLADIEDVKEEMINEYTEIEEVQVEENLEEDQVLEEVTLKENEVLEEVVLEEEMERQENVSEALEDNFNEYDEFKKEESLISIVDFDEESEENIEEVSKLEYIKRINQKNQTTMYVLSILRFFPYIEPFEHNLKGFNWWIVEMDKENEYRSFLPYFSHITGGNRKDMYSDGITCSELMVKYKHYLFGLYNENEKVKYYVYAVPGHFSSAEHPNRGVDGFNTWIKGKNNIGYWIVYIDPMTGKPVYPKVPMAPQN